MSYLKTEGSVGLFDLKDCREKGALLSEAHQSAEPFPHSVIDDFLDSDLLGRCLKTFPAQLEEEDREFHRAQEKLKRSFNPDYLDAETRGLFYSLNSRPFLTFLENLTGIKGLIPDPYFVGGGFHETRTGGHLSVHADFNHHKKLNLERRINVLIYLNKDWKDEYGGTLELWDVDMKEAVARVTPQFNRCVIFNTTSYSYHGHPSAINHPDGIPRRSIALYYYTATWDEDRQNHSTLFKVRPQTEDRVDYRVKSDAFFREILPPILYRIIIRAGRKLGRLFSSKEGKTPAE